MSLIDDLLASRRRVLIEVILAAGGFAVALALDSMVQAAAIIGIGYLLRLVLAAGREVRAWFIVGGLVWAGSDVAFVQVGVFSYATETWLGPPWYMPLLFGQLAVVTGTALTAFGDREKLPPLWIDGLILAAASGSVLLFYSSGYMALAIAFPVALIVRAAVGRFDGRAIAAAVAVGVIEPLIELALIRAGLFAFSDPGPGGLPIWYWAYFGLASFAIRRVFCWSQQVTVQPSAG